MQIFAAAGECDLPEDCEPFCDPANNNSSGGPATLTATATGDAAPLAGYRLECTGGPLVPTSGPGSSNGFGFFLVSDGNTANVILGEGVLCLNGPQGRYNPAAGGMLNSLGQFSPTGEFENLSGTSTTGFGFDCPLQLPNPPGGVVVGNKWYFQLWFRDVDANGDPTVNLSNGVGIDFP